MLLPSIYSVNLFIVFFPTFLKTRANLVPASICSYMLANLYNATQ